MRFNALENSLPVVQDGRGGIEFYLGVGLGGSFQLAEVNWFKIFETLKWKRNECDSLCALTVTDVMKSF